VKRKRLPVLVLHYAKTCSIRKRIRRAARFAGFTVKDFVWRALAGSVNCCEEDMILNPKNGRPLLNDVELESFMVKHELDV
jgi:hypothetical protein